MSEMPEPGSKGRSSSALRRARRTTLSALVAVTAIVVAPLQVFQASQALAAGPCGPPVVSVIACENTLPGTPSSDWDITGSGSSTIQGFATAISVTPGQTVQFKINTPSRSYHYDILRLGYYQGNGARKVAANLKPSATLPQTQPPCLTAQDSTGLIDCGNWGVSASWTVPTTAVSGVYIAHLVRDDAVAESHMVFIVRDDSSHSDLLVQTSDETWQAYNSYGGNSLYTCSVSCPPGSPAAYKGAAKVSYNRPFHTADDDQGRSWLMYSEYPMIRFLEQNGYDLSYTTGIDVGTSAGGALLTNHKAFLSVGHDEYWSGSQRANVEAARDNGVDLAFFSGNEVFWKTRTESSVDGTATANRTLVCYKETHYDGVVDPKDPPTWTGTWADPRFSPPADGGRPQNGLTGQLFLVNSGTTDIKVPAQYSKLRFWRNTPVAGLTTGQTVTLGSGLGTLGYEWDEEPDNGFRPAGLLDLSSTTSTSAEIFTDYGSTVKTGSTATHHLSLYRAASGALVFGAGTVQWSWGLGDPQLTPDRTMQQATVNLFADMGAQPYAVTTGLTVASASTDSTAPTSTITSPAGGATIGDGGKLTVSGTAADTGGVVAGVEVSTDGGATWHPATGTTSWSYSWVAHGNPSTTIRSRAVDDSGNLETPAPGTTVNVGCTCSVWGVGTTPGKADSGTAGAVEVGVKFKSDVSGSLTGIRFYKASTNSGTHVGNLWTASGTKLASVTFANESTSGWQQATFSSPVSINANTTYVASYFAPAGHTALDEGYMFPHPSPQPDGNGTVDSPPLHALRNVNGTLNGLFQNSATSTFPTASVNARNYWVDVMFNPNTGPATAPGAPTSVTATPGNASAIVTWTAPSDGGSAITRYTVTPFVGSTAQTPIPVSGNPPDTTLTVTGLSNGTAYTFTVSATNAVGTGPTSAASVGVIPAATSCAACTLWPSSAAPETADEGDPSSVEVGVKFKADVNGQIKGIRFYKATTNTGTHIGSLWTSTGTKLASATFGTETSSGWQQVLFATPVTITANTIYVASYFAPGGHYAGDGGYFAASGVDSGPLHALKDGVSGGNAVYRYGTTTIFPTNTFNSENYWVDVVFTTGAATAPAAPGTVTATPGAGTATVSWTAPSDGGSPVTSYTVTPFIGTTAQTATVVSGSPPATSTTISGLTNGTTYTFKVAATNAVGTGPVSASSNSVTPTAPTAPAAPTGVAATAGDGSAAVSWTAPANGGSAVTSYTVTPFIGATAQSPSTVTGSPPATTTTVTGLTNGTSYTFTVSATNAVGTGPASSPSSAVTPTGPTAPAAPTAVTATAGDSSAVVGWTAPSNGGSPITSYTVTPYVGAAAQTPTTVTGSPPVTTTTVAGLTNGTAYTFTVSATNAVGAGPESAASSAVTPAPATVPAAPSGVTATAGDGSAVVSWTAPANGGSPITGYTVTPFVGTVAQTTSAVSGSPPATSTTVTGLTNGTDYTFTVSATNAVGTGPASGASATVRPVASGCSACTIWPASTTPTTVDEADASSVEVGVKFRADVNGMVKGIRFYKGAANTGTHIGTLWSAGGTKLASATFSSETATGWQQVLFTSPVAVTANTVYVASYFAPAGHYSGDSGYFATAGKDSAPLHALQDGVSGGNGVYAYGATSLFPVNTFNSENYWVDLVFAAGAATAPSAPTGVTASAANASAVVTWTAPSDGGSAITTYTVTPFIGTTPQAATTVTGSPPATTTTVPGLTNGTAYTFKVSATNAVGTGAASAASNVVTPAAPPAPTAPAAPTAVSATAGDSSATVTWTAPSNGGSAITSYTVTPFVGTTAQTPSTVTGSPPATTTVVTGLTNGTAYTFTVSATNAVGTGPTSVASNAVTPNGVVCTACTIWAATATPTTPASTDTLAVEVGVKFKADVSGRITGIRFFKGAGNTGTHIGNLWSLTGTKLASGTFTSESASGWQQVSFTAPVAITAGTVYVASYFAPVGRYAADAKYLSSVGVDTPPLHALKNGVSGGNGVFRYGSTSGFPNKSGTGTNYWVDVVFATG
ncbi:DUF4082 domain-containing protein [Pedococcus sp. 5OH_020]|uniref:DUF4082 domain-containing protein n=1 Tax=Pedococcus sp. 5OH_020 TaxID=2989814 RepID=UPI0022E9E6F0|nr:DUF4082 domain-containing protein [Pedococcus sp. 5OH_020]